MGIPDKTYYRGDSFSAQGFIQSQQPNRWLLLAALVLILIVAVGLGYTLHDRQLSRQLAATNAQLGAQLNRTQDQLTALTARLNALTAPMVLQPLSPADESWLARPEAPAPSAIRRIASSHHRATAPQWEKRMQLQLAQQKQQIAATRQDLEKERADLENNLTPARGRLSDLSGSIARNHSELVALERLGERNYYEFDLIKSKRFQPEGPISVSLRHTSAKHKNYDLALVVDDFRLTKKHVNLYEPLIFETPRSPQPLELVVNRIDKNHVHGYVSVPKPATAKIARLAHNPASEDSQPVSGSAAPSGSTASLPSEVSLTRRP